MASNNPFETPMMKQYQAIKAEYADCILLFRLGDFYEMFLEDAKVGAKILDIVLTRRSRGKDGDIPMAGIPYHALDNYIAKLTQAGHKVALCDQVSLPDGSGLVDRAVTRVYTPGSTLPQANHTQAQYIVHLYNLNSTVGIAVADYSAGFFAYSQFTYIDTASLTHHLKSIQAKLKPAEWLLNNKNLEKIVTNDLRVTVPVRNFEEKNLKNISLEKQFANVPELNKPTKLAIESLLQYLAYIHQGAPQHITQLLPLETEELLQLDANTIANLELIEPLSHQYQTATLFELLDGTKTPMGHRLLKDWLLHPLFNKKNITDRHDVIEWALANRQLIQDLQNLLQTLPDLVRLCATITTQANNPRKVSQLGEAITQLGIIEKTLGSVKKIPATLGHLQKMLKKTALKKLAKEIEQTLLESPPTKTEDGGYIDPNHTAKLKKHTDQVTAFHTWLTEYETQLKKASSLTTLKVGFNKVYGYYLEVSKSFVDQVPDSFIRRQTLVNAERYITDEMKAREEAIQDAQAQAIEIEAEIFAELIEKINQTSTAIQSASHAIAELDCLLSLATIADELQWHRPTFAKNNQIKITGGRHPMVEAFVKKQDSSFIANDVAIGGQAPNTIILTGPNMAGKSVIMRQTALIVILAQMGSFVPAEQAELPLLDHIFVRSGASDAISQGLSTFMVEMSETAYILQTITPKSLVIMDEIGRGTSTYDGISIAWALVEHLRTQENPALTLFTTHFHELENLAEQHDDVANFHMAVEEHPNNSDQPLFLYTLEPGGAGNSFGLAVARSAGLPSTLITRAEELLHQHVTTDTLKTKNSEPVKTTTSTNKSEVTQKIKQLDISQTTPLQALNLLANLQQEIN